MPSSLIEGFVVGGLLFCYAGVLAWSIYEMWTMPPDDDRWQIYKDASEPDDWGDDFP